MGTGIRAVNLCKVYRLYDRPIDRFREWLSGGRKKLHREVNALRGITLEVEHGSALGIVGSNGAGKSTLLKILSGTSVPSSGEFSIDGTVSSLLELGTGFYPGFTGYQNIFLNGMVMGFTREQMEAKVDEIIEFSELGGFIHQPIRTYSSGMIMRLGFSVATAVDPDVLIIDEILAVGDLHFQKRCIDRILSFRAAGKTILFCSHSMFHVEEICDHAVWIQNGAVRMYGKSADVCRTYESYERSRRVSHGSLVMGEELRADSVHLAADAGAEEPAPEGDLPHITHLRVTHGDDGEDAKIEHPETGMKVWGGYVLDDLTVEIEYTIPHDLPEFVVGLAVYRGDQEMMVGLASHMGDFQPPGRRGNYRAYLSFPRVRLLHGSYKLVAYIAGARAMHIFHSYSLPGPFLLKQRTSYLGVLYMEHSWRVQRLEAERARPSPAEPAGGAVHGDG